ncbi:MAG: Fis family transcriptional regulator [Alphaproteobacteria bacterium]|nr:Fis family transcriptional regulator [Alphaproteobacteria bacterium]
MRKIDRTGSRFDDFLEEEGLLAEAEAVAIKRVLAWQVAEAMRARKLSKDAMAKRMRTSRSQLDRLLDPETASVTLATMTRAAAAVGKRLNVKLVNA